MSLPPTNEEGVDTAHTVEAHRRLFQEKMDVELAKKNNTAYPISEELFNRKFAFVRLQQSGVPIVKLRDEHNYSMAYVWGEKYDIITIGSCETLVYKETPDIDGQLPAYDKYKKVSCRSTCFNDIRGVHIQNGGHKKSRKLFDACKTRFGASLPIWATDMLVATCPNCITKSTRKKPKAGHQPIITRGFGARGQIDLIDMQSMPDGPFNWIINYTDHGIKLTLLGALCKKECRGVAWHLFQLFCLIGPPAILQADNGREFNGMALGGKGGKAEISDEVKSTPISNIFLL